jgi:glucose-6-phosphate 1-dehydrogenase
MTDGAASDALVIFRITGDLARHKTFPALYQLGVACCSRSR